jgi:flavin-dependent dehydrogenase
VFDVAVVGSGPAAAATAISLASAGRSVTLIERVKPAGFGAGETLDPEVRSSLIQLGVWQRFVDSGAQPTHAIWSAWGSSRVIARDYVAGPHGPAWRVDRTGFDRMLIAASREAGAHVPGAFHRIELQRSAGGWRISASHHSDVQTLDARFVVDATGRGAAVARTCGGRWIRRDRLVALLGQLTPTGVPVEAGDVLLIESVPQGWWYSSLLPAGELVAALVTDADLMRRHPRSPAEMWSEALAVSNYTSARAAAFTRCAFCVRAANVGCAERAAGTDWMAVGDAASTIDPLSGLGITKALRGAILGARAVDEALSGRVGELETYADRIRNEFESFLRIGSKYYCTESRWPDSPFWQRRIYNR